MFETRRFRESVIGIFLKKKREIPQAYGEVSIVNRNTLGDVLNDRALLVGREIGPVVVEVFAFRSNFLTRDLLEIQFALEAPPLGRPKFGAVSC